MDCSVPVWRNDAIKGNRTPLTETARGKMVFYKLADISCAKSQGDCQMTSWQAERTKKQVKHYDLFHIRTMEGLAWALHR